MWPARAAASADYIARPWEQRKSPSSVLSLASLAVGGHAVDENDGNCRHRCPRRRSTSCRRQLIAVVWFSESESGSGSGSGSTPHSEPVHFVEDSKIK